MKRLYISLFLFLSVISVNAGTWYDSISFASCDASQDQTDSSFMFWVTVPSVAAGTASQIRVGINGVASDGIGIKVALYDSTGTTLLASVTSTVNIADSGTQKAFTISDTVLSAADYIVAVDVNAGNGQFLYSTKSGTTGTSIGSGTYSGFPPSSLSPLATGFATSSFGVFVTSGGPTPTSTPTNTPTPTATATVTPTATPTQTPNNWLLFFPN